jgi:hypothetical protein
MATRKKPSLHQFLRKEIAKGKNRVKPPEPDERSPPDAAENTPSTTPHSTSPIYGPNPSILLDEGEVESLFGPDVDSLFGEPYGTLTIKEQEQAAKLRELLAGQTSDAVTAAPRFTESEELRELREEMKAIVLLEAGGEMEGRARGLAARMKGALLEEVRWRRERERWAFEGSFSFLCLLGGWISGLG